MSEDIYSNRIEKLNELRRLGFDPYAVEKFETKRSIAQILDEFESLLPLEEQHAVAGRIVGLRNMGKAAFFHVSDGDSKIQVYLRKDEVNDETWQAFLLLDLGDHIAIHGKPFVTKTGENSLHASAIQPLSKSLHAWPLGKEKDGQKWYSLSDVEQRYRHRHLDLVANADTRKMLLDRSRVTQAVREYFWSQEFLEVETPMLQIEAGGAAARPFLTHFNHYKLDVKLRISLELYLKRIICGDVPRVFEVGRVFRNESISNRHNPEFTMIEWYEAYANLEDTQLRVEKCFESVAKKITGGSTVVQCGEHELDFGKPWKRVDMIDEICKQTGVEPSCFATLETAKEALAKVDIASQSKALGGWVDLNKEDQLGGLIEKLLEVFVEPNLIQPTFVVGYPIETSPLAKKDPQRPGYTRRSEGYVLGREVCNLFSEINDPIDQRERFEQQMRERSKGDDEAHPMDEEFLFALECGMPPTGGCGIGIDRMAMLLTGAEHIREVLLFPTMKPVEKSAEPGE